jgi:hypothetical protein
MTSMKIRQEITAIGQATLGLAIVVLVFMGIGGTRRLSAAACPLAPRRSARCS